MLNHKQKVKLARKISGRVTGHFDSEEWKNHAKQIELKSKKLAEEK